MSVNDLTLGEIKELIELFGNKPTENHVPYKVGENYLIRTVTMIQIGKLESIGDKELVLSNASWIADTDRFHNALKDGKLREVEPFIDNVIVGRGAIVDATIWRHELPREQK